MTDRDRLLLGEIKGTLEGVAADVKDIKARVPSECAVHTEKLDNHSSNIKWLWVTVVTISLCLIVVGGPEAAKFIAGVF